MPRHDGTAARQLIADMYGCSSGILNDPEIIKNTARRAVEMIGAEIVEESLHRFAPVGITYFAVITTSHFSIHTWPEFGDAAVDVFSCADGVPDSVAEFLKTAFGASSVRTRLIERIIGTEGSSAGARGYRSPENHAF